LVADGTADATVRANIGALFVTPSVGRYTITSSVNNVAMRHFTAALPQKLRRTIALADAKFYAAGSGLRVFPTPSRRRSEWPTGPAAARPVMVAAHMAKKQMGLIRRNGTGFRVERKWQVYDGGAIDGSLHVQAGTIAPVVSVFSTERRARFDYRRCHFEWNI